MGDGGVREKSIWWGENNRLVASDGRPFHGNTSVECRSVGVWPWRNVGSDDSGDSSRLSRDGYTIEILLMEIVAILTLPWEHVREAPNGNSGLLTDVERTTVGYVRQAPNRRWGDRSTVTSTILNGLSLCLGERPWGKLREAPRSSLDYGRGIR